MKRFVSFLTILYCLYLILGIVLIETETDMNKNTDTDIDTFYDQEQYYHLYKAEYHPLNYIPKYFQPYDKFSFNLNSYTDITKLYSSFGRVGDLVAYNRFFNLIPMSNNSLSLFYTKDFLNLTAFQLQLDFRFYPEKKRGTILGVYFLNDNLSEQEIEELVLNNIAFLCYYQSLSF